MSLMKFLTTPAKLASTLDWKKLGGSILTLDIGHELLGVAVASHPSSGQSTQKLKPIPMKLETRANKIRTLAPEVVEELQSIVKEHNICGFLVNWPVQKDGRCGAACGRVLHTLDSLAKNSSVITPNHPFCLWDGEHVTPKEDEWGRCPSYGQPSTKTLHIASHEQYSHESSSSIAASIWNDFCQEQWPELKSHNDNDEDKPNKNHSTGSEFCDVEWLDNYEDTTAYMKMSAF